MAPEKLVDSLFSLLFVALFAVFACRFFVRVHYSGNLPSASTLATINTPKSATTTASFHTHSRSHSSAIWVPLVTFIGFFIIVLFFLLFRLGTFRTLVIGPLDGTSEVSLFGKFNHKETDELVFQYLVQSVGENFWDYSLHNKEVLRLLGLANDNYNDTVFM
jgi:hypothetical protein